MLRALGLQKSIIYGPVDSRRLGRSLGINLSPTAYKACSFNCVYCHYGWTRFLEDSLSNRLSDIPSAEAVERELIEYLNKLAMPPDYITFSGNGEPTLHPDFWEIVNRVIKVRDIYCPQAKIALLSNSTGVGNPGVRDAIRKIDLPIMKLDAGNDDVLRRVNRPVPQINVRALVESLKTIGRFTMQSVFVDGEVTNADSGSLEDWLEAVIEIRPESVQVYSLENAPAMAGLEAVSNERLEKIAEMLRNHEIKAQIF
ncbi:MAG: radical SAM protein [bacterium]